MMTWFREQYRLSHEFYRDHIRSRFLILLAVFLALSVASYFVLHALPETADKIYDAFAKLVEEMGVGEDGTVSWYALLGNNARSAALSTAMGLLPFVFLPLFPLVSNAAIIGGVLAVTAARGASVGVLVLWGLLPHGVFEIPAILLAIAEGLWLCRNMCRLALHHENAVALERALPALLRFWLCVVLPLLVAAALVESFITPLLLQRFI